MGWVWSPLPCNSQFNFDLLTTLQNRLKFMRKKYQNPWLPFNLLSALLWAATWKPNLTARCKPLAHWNFDSSLQAASSPYHFYSSFYAFMDEYAFQNINTAFQFCKEKYICINCDDLQTSTLMNLVWWIYVIVMDTCYWEQNSTCSWIINVVVAVLWVVGSQKSWDPTTISTTATIFITLLHVKYFFPYVTM